MKKVIRINNATKLEEIREAAREVISQIEEGWETKMQKAKTEYYGLSWFGRWWQRNIKAFFTIKNKFDELEIAEMNYKYGHRIQYDRCKAILHKLELVKNIDLDEEDCKRLWLEDLWEKSSKISVD